MHYLEDAGALHLDAVQHHVGTANERANSLGEIVASLAQLRMQTKRCEGIPQTLNLTGRSLPATLIHAI